MRPVAETQKKPKPLQEEEEEKEEEEKEEKEEREGRRGREEKYSLKIKEQSFKVTDERYRIEVGC